MIFYFSLYNTHLPFSGFTRSKLTCNLTHALPSSTSPIPHHNLNIVRYLFFLLCSCLWSDTHLASRWKPRLVVHKLITGVQ